MIILGTEDVPGDTVTAHDPAWAGASLRARTEGIVTASMSNDGTATFTGVQINTAVYDVVLDGNIIESISVTITA
jgi:hypothetical protein